MTTPFSIYWEVANVEISKDFSTRRNIKKPVLFPRYKGLVGEADVPCAYVGSKEINPASSLNSIRLEDSIIENSRTSFSSELTWIGNTGYTSARYFLLTDIVGEYLSFKPEPFYRKHVLPSGDIDPASVAILDSNLNELDSNSYVAERIAARDEDDLIVSGSYESCSVYSNYINSYNKETGDVEIYFVRYAVSGSTHYQILSSEPAFSEATIDDISLVTGQIKSWRKVYLVEEGPSFFTVITPQVGSTYYLSPLETSRIIARDPVDSSDEVPWFMNVSNGSFSILRDSEPYYYSVPEFLSQTFSPVYPYKVEVEEEAEYLRSDILKIDRTPIQTDSSLYKMDVIIRNAQNETLYALTTETSRAGEYYKEAGERVYRTLETDNAWVTWDANGISGVDTEGGFVHLQREYPDTYYFYVTYYYKETGLEVTTLNVNPVFDEEYNGQFYVLYIVPTGGDNDNDGRSTAIQYLKVDRSGRVIEASQDGTNGNFDIESNISVGEQNMYYSRAASVTGWGTTGNSYVTVTSVAPFPTSGILVWENLSGSLEYEAYSSKQIGPGWGRFNFESYTLTEDLPIGTAFWLHSFIDPYTTAGTNNYQWLVLNEIHIGSTSRVDELSIIDLRVSGGVVKDTYKEDALAIDPRAIWARSEIITSRGQPIPGDTATVIKIPYTLLSDYGGDFSMEQIEAIVGERHLGVGVVPLILLDGAIPEITSMTSTTSSITIYWESEGTEYSYRVYRSFSSSGPWTLVATLSDDAYSNYYTIQGLTSGLIYYIAVSAVDSNGVEGPKGTSWGIKTRTS